LRKLVASPALEPLLGYVSRPRADPVVERVALIEDLGELPDVGELAVVLLSRAASVAASTYRFDVALRVARARSVAALVLTARDAARITPTAAAIADRSGTALLGTGDAVDLAALATAIARELAGDAEVALLRAHTALRAIDAHPPGGDTESLLRSAGGALGVPITMVPAEPANGPRRPMVVDGHLEAWLVAPAQDGDMGVAVDIVLHATAAAAADALARAERAEELPVQSRDEVLTDLLSATPQTRAAIVTRARNLGLPIDGSHVAVRLDFEALADPAVGEEVAAYQARVRLATAALQAVRASGGSWHAARTGEALILVSSSREDPGAAAANRIASLMDQVLAGLGNRLPATVIRCGVGSPHPGPAGLLASVAEAKAATIAARTSDRANIAVAFDSAGLRRTLVEWYASDTAREAVASVLQPLAQLGGARAERLIRTLHVYLDERGSMTRTGERLNLHRNAVAYRIKQAFELLDVDEDNPDDLLLLQLACRARELG
jgi:sugar diacid utilization regulator